MISPTVAQTEPRLPTAEELPCSDDTPVDNEDQNNIPNWLLAILTQIWKQRQDWFFGVDMGIYTREGQKKRSPTVVPDAFLSLGVQRHKRNPFGRLSYVLQEENDIVPILVVEYVSKTYGGEYDRKMEDYADLGILYYVIYNPEHSKRHPGHNPFEVYKLANGQYIRQSGEPFWFPEIGLGIGRISGQFGPIEREWLTWFDEANQPYPLLQEAIEQLEQQLQQQRMLREQEQLYAEQQKLRAEQEHLRAEQEHLRAEQAEQALQQILNKLQQRGIDPEQL